MTAVIRPRKEAFDTIIQPRHSHTPMPEINKRRCNWIKKQSEHDSTKIKNKKCWKRKHNHCLHR